MYVTKPCMALYHSQTRRHVINVVIICSCYNLFFFHATVIVLASFVLTYFAMYKNNPVYQISTESSGRNLTHLSRMNFKKLSLTYTPEESSNAYTFVLAFS